MAATGRRLSPETQKKLVDLVIAVQDRQKKNSPFIDKLRSIDEAYGKQFITIENNDADCTTNGNTEEVIKVPIVASEVDTIAAELINTFANQDPLFGILSERGKPEYAMQFQALLSRDARQQGWGRQISLFCSNAARYNVAGLEADKIWQRDTNITTSEETLDAGFESILDPVTALKAVDMYNSLFDYRVAPADLAREGEYVGYNELYTRTRLKTLGNTLSEKEAIYNATEVYNSSISGAADYWNIRPDISNIPAVDPIDSESWINWLGIVNDETKLKLVQDSYLVTKLYIRVIPSELGISTSARPMIIKIRVVNNKYLFSYNEVVTPLDLLPIAFCDLREDGFGYQTHSIGENVVPYQDAATELLDTRLEGSKRTLDDRAIYDPYYIDSKHVNSRITTSKIPLKSDLRNSGDRPALNQLYYPIPFESNATVSALSDLSTILQIKDDVNGTNFSRRGEQRPGNRTLGEFDQLNASSNLRTIPYNLRIEEQVMVPIRLLIKVYTLSSSKTVQKVYDSVNERELTINLAELRAAMLEYRVTGGLRPKQLLRDPSMLSTALQFVQNSPELNQEYNVAGIFAELLASVNIDISKHKREVPQNAIQPTNASPGVQPAATDTGGEGTT